MSQKISFVAIVFFFFVNLAYSQQNRLAGKPDSITILRGIQLTAMVNEQLIGEMRPEIGYSMGFTDPDTASHKAYNLIIFSAAAYGKNFFQRGAVYDIYAVRYDGKEAIVPLDVFYPSPLLPLLAKKIMPGH
jgi:hypothetical protein